MYKLPDPGDTSIIQKKVFTYPPLFGRVPHNGVWGPVFA